GQQRNERVVHLVERAVLDRLLRDPHGRADRLKHVHLLQLAPERGQTGTRRKVTRIAGDGRLVHGDEPPVIALHHAHRSGSSLLAWPVPSSLAHAAAILAKISVLSLDYS